MLARHRAFHRYGSVHHLVDAVHRGLRLRLILRVKKDRLVKIAVSDMANDGIEQAKLPGLLLRDILAAV